MNISRIFLRLFFTLLLMGEVNAETWKNPIPPRLQWKSNYGYCGEVSLISAGLYYGQYISQYDIRAIASPHIPQSQFESQLLLGVNDEYAAAQVHLKGEAWNGRGKTSNQFLSWVKQNVIKGYPVLIGIYANKYLFYGNSNPDAGDPDYDHIVPVIGISSKYDQNDLRYYGDDRLQFSDDGFWGNESDSPYYFEYAFDAFQANRRQANAKNGAIYSLSNRGPNYGIAITGVIDLDGDTLPVRLETNVNDETPSIIKGSDTRPQPMPITLKITISGLEPGVKYHLYRYNHVNLVPHSNFNGHASQASEKWSIQIASGNSYTMTQQINSNEMVFYRAVKDSAP